MHTTMAIPSHSLTPTNRNRDESRPLNPAGRDAPTFNEGSESTSFTMLLDVARMVYVDSNSLMPSSPTSPMQMFESIASDSHEHRQTVMQQQYDSDQRRHDPGRNDSTSVQARSQNQERGEVNLRLQNGHPGADPVRMSDSLSTSENKKLPLGATVKPESHEMKSVSTPASSPSANHRTLPTNVASQAVTELSNAPNSTHQAVVSAASAMKTTTSGNPTPQIAQQVGQVLAASRGGEVESARAIQPAQEATHTRTQSADQKNSASTLTKSPGDSKPFSSTTKQTESTTRSEFDQLVRSIRMKPGLWQSSAKLRLDPPSLGAINIDVRLVGKKIEISVKTESLEAAERLSQQAAKLKSALQQQGIFIERFDVSMEDTPHQTDRESESSLADTTTQDRQESNHTSMHNRMTGEVVELSDPMLETTDELEFNTVAERRIDIKV